MRNRLITSHLYEQNPRAAARGLFIIQYLKYIVHSHFIGEKDIDMVIRDIAFHSAMDETLKRKYQVKAQSSQDIRCPSKVRNSTIYLSIVFIASRALSPHLTILSKYTFPLSETNIAKPSTTPTGATDSLYSSST